MNNSLKIGVLLARLPVQFLIQSIPSTQAGKISLCEIFCLIGALFGVLVAA